jgi:hypothetical protein
MTCTHVLGLIDAGPFAGYPRAHLETAWQHARQCATCGPALRAATALTTDLAALPQVLPPKDCSGPILARIARIDEARAAAAARPETRARSGTREWPDWAALGSLAAGLTVLLSMAADYSPSFHGASARFGALAPGFAAMPSTPIEAIGLAIGLVLYVAWLFPPLGGRSRP